jgi:hypothetical protein
MTRRVSLTDGMTRRAPKDRRPVKQPGRLTKALKPRFEECLQTRHAQDGDAHLDLGRSGHPSLSDIQLRFVSYMQTLSKRMFWQFGIGPASLPKLKRNASANLAALELGERLP